MEDSDVTLSKQRHKLRKFALHSPARSEEMTGSDREAVGPGTARQALGQARGRQLLSRTEARLYEANSSSELSDTEADDEEESPARRRVVTPRVRSEIHVPSRQQRSGSRVRFGGVFEDKYYTCVSDQEMDDADAAQGHGVRFSRYDERSRAGFRSRRGEPTKPRDW